MNVFELYEKHLEMQKFIEAVDNGCVKSFLENRRYKRIQKVRQQLSRENSIQYYNVKHIKKLNSEEYVFYDCPVVTGLRKSFNHVEYEEIDGIQYNKETGEQRTEESIKHSQINSLKRTKQKIYDYAFSNDWSDGWFLTVTFNSDFVDRYNYDECLKRIQQLIRTIKKNNPNCKYIFVPERHKDGAWHFHALITNCENLIMIDSGKRQKGKKVYNINLRSYKYGFTTATKVEDTNKVSSYITKYITKELIDNTQGKHRYLFSKNLEVPTVTTEWIIEDSDIELKKMLIERSERFQSKKVIEREKKVLEDGIPTNTEGKEIINRIEYYRLKI